MPVKKLITAVLFSAACLTGVHAGNTFSIGDGLSNGSVKAIVQDTCGYIWLGTRNGLNRFDGYEFKNYSYVVEGNSRKNDIVSICPGKDDVLWIGTFDGVMLFDPYSDTFISPETVFDGELPEGVVVGVYVSEKNGTWVATKKGLYRFSGRDCAYISEFAGKNINSMGWCGDNNIIVDVVGEGLYTVNIADLSCNSVSGNGYSHREPVVCMLFDGDAATWLFVEADHILRYDRMSGRISKVDLQLSGIWWTGVNQVHSALQTGDNTILLATDTGLLEFDTDRSTVSDYRPATGNIPFPESDRIMSLFIDRNGSLWIGTFEDGAAFYNPRLYSFSVTDLGHTRNERMVSEIVEAGDCLVFASHSVISVLNTRTQAVENIDVKTITGNSHAEIYAMAGSGSYDVLIYVLNVGTFSLDISDMTVSKVSLNLSPSDQIREMCEDADGNIWIAADELGIYDCRNGEIRTELTTNESGITRYMLTQSIFREKNGCMLVGTRNNGIWRYPYLKGDNGRYSDAVRLPVSGMPEDANVTEIFEDSRGNIWMGTYNSGLYVCGVDGGDCLHFTVDEGLPNNTVCGIVEDRSGRLWISTLTGIAMIDAGSRSVVPFGQINGYPMSENSQGVIHAASDGRIYVGGTAGVVAMYPDELLSFGNGEDRVRISSIASILNRGDEDFEIFDCPALLENVRFSHENTSLQIKVSSLDYVFQPAIRYAYRLKGGDQWNVSEKNTILLSNLRYGKHVLQFRLSDEYGRWSQHITEQTVVISPPWYLTSVMKVFYVLVIVAVLYMLFKFLSDKRSMKYHKIIDEMEKENIEKAYRIRMELFTQFSHELRTPLTLISDPVEDILSDKSLPEKFRYPVQQISRNANKMLLLVNQLLDFRKIESGNLKLRLSRIDCKSFLDSQTEKFAGIASKNSVTLSVRYDSDIDDLWGDQDLLDKVMDNLLSNAIKNSGKDSEVETGMYAIPGNLVRIYVRDHGIGIARENHEKIFEPFFQVSPDRGAKSFGSGIGLALVKYIVNLHKGSVRVESELGKGSTFIVELQRGYSHFSNEEVFTALNELREGVDARPKPTGNNAPEQETLPSEASRDIIILVAEDDAELREYIRKRLSVSYTVLLADDGVSAYETAKTRIPDLIVSDIMMPGMDGIEFCSKVKQDMATSHIPVILLTAKSQQESIEEGYRALADDYVLKPFSSKILLAKIDSLIANRRRLKALFSASLGSDGFRSDENRKKDPFMEKLINIIREHIDEPELSVGFLYEEMGMSRAQFFRKVKGISDLSPNKLIVGIKMNMAAEMLRKGDRNISEVAYNTGYADPSYFAKVFKSVYNMSPTEYMGKYKSHNNTDKL